MNESRGAGRWHLSKISGNFADDPLSDFGVLGENPDFTQAFLPHVQFESSEVEGATKKG
jgi:hypothetical protein